MAGNDHSRPPFTLSRRDVLAGTLAAPVFGRPFSVTADDRVMLGAGPNGLAVPKMGVGESNSHVFSELFQDDADVKRAGRE